MGVSQEKMGRNELETVVIGRCLGEFHCKREQRSGALKRIFLLPLVFSVVTFFMLVFYWKLICDSLVM